MKINQIFEGEKTPRKNYIDFIKWCDGHMLSKEKPAISHFDLQDESITYNDDMLSFTFDKPTEFPSSFTSTIKNSSIYIDGPLLTLKNSPINFRRYFWVGCKFSSLKDYPQSHNVIDADHRFAVCNNLTDINGLPNVKFDDLHFDDCENLTSSVVSQLPKTIKWLRIKGCPKLKSLSGIHKNDRRIGSLNIGSYVQHGLLGLVLMTTEFSEYSAVDDGNGKIVDLKNALRILKKYQGRGREGVLSAQQELIDNDLDDYAEL